MTQVISVVSSKGGACKTTACVCLAAEYARRGRRVLVIDADGPQHHATDWLKAGNDLAAIDIVTGPRSVAAAVEKADGGYDVVLVDIMGADTATLSLAAANADLVVVPATNSPLDLEGVTRTVERLRSIENELAGRGMGRRIPYRVLLSRTEPETTLYRVVRQRLADAEVPVLAAEIRRRIVYQEAALIGSAPAFLGDLRAREEIERVRQELDAALAAETAETEAA